MANTNTTNNLVPFQFESASIRIVTDEHGEPWFVGKDICDALGYKDHTNALKQHCKGVVKHHPISDSLGRMQATRILAEPDVLRLIVGSTLPAAEAFERWVFEEVLPSIRKTGAYSTPARAMLLDEVAEVKLRCHLSAAQMLGVPLYLGQIEAVKAVRADTGVDFSPLLLAAPAQNDIKPEQEMLEPTEMGKRRGISGRKVNLVLCELGLQERLDGAWVPTASGNALCSKHSWVKGEKSGFNLKWNVQAIEALGSR